MVDITGTAVTTLRPIGILRPAVLMSWLRCVLSERSYVFRELGPGTVHTAVDGYDDGTTAHYLTDTAATRQPALTTSRSAGTFLRTYSSGRSVSAVHSIDRSQTRRPRCCRR